MIKTFTANAFLTAWGCVGIGAFMVNNTSAETVGVMVFMIGCGCALASLGGVITLGVREMVK